MGWTDGLDDLAAISPETRRALDALAVSDVAQDTVLFRPGDTVLGYVIVLEGRVGVHLIGPSGRDILLYDVTPGTACIQSTLGLLGGESYSGEAVAETPVRLVLLPRTLFLSLIDTDAAFRRLVLGAFAGRMQALMQVLEKVAFQRIETRLAAHLLARADAEGRVLATQSELARAIGSAREVVSRRLDAMARQGLITLARGEVRLRDGAALRRAAEDMAI